MKKVTSLIVIFLMGLTALFAQAPEKFTYQAVVRNASNALVTNAPVSVRVSILQGSVTGSLVYMEMHTVPTNANGLLTIEIGGGTVQQGSFADINWANGPFLLKTEIDPAGGSNYSVTSTQQLMSVPYALYAKEAANGFSGDYNDLTNQPTIPSVPTNVSAFNNDAGYITMESVPSIPTNVSAFTNDAGYITNADIPTVPTNVSAFTNDAGYLTSFSEQQVLSISNDTLFLTGGSYVKLPNGFSGDYNDLVNQPDLFSGSYNDLTNKPTNADFGQALVRGTVNNPAGATDIAVTFSNYSLVSGGVVSIIFARNVPAGASLNINSQGSKPILWRGAALTDGIIKANDRCLFMYNSGANSYYLLAIDRWGVDIDALAAVARTGSYNDLSDKPTIPTVPTNVSAFTNDAGYLTSFTEQQVLSISHDTLFLTGGSYVKLPNGFSGDYNDLVNQPDLFSGSYNDLTNKPTNADFGQALVRGTVNNPAGATDIAVTFSNYSLVSGGVVSIIFARNVPAGASLNINDQGAKPISWRGAALTDGIIKANDRCLFMYNAAANRFYLLAIDRWGVDIDALAAVARTGSYNDLSDKPTIPTVPTDVSAFNNDAGYITMDSVPAVPTSVSAFTNDAGYLTSFTEQQVLSISHDTLFLTGGSFVKLPAGFDGDYNSLTNKPDLFSGDYNDLTNKPTLFSGSYNDLTNKPTLFSGSYNDLTNKPTNADFGQALVRGTVNNPTGATDIAVTFSNYSLVSGGVVSIIFARNVPAGASLNINDQGAKPISWRGAALTDGIIKANDRCLFMYNAAANRFYLLAIDRWGVDIDALAAVARTGSYNDLSDKPTIPTVPTDVSAFNNDAGYITMDSVPAVPTNVSAFTNDAGYITESDISDIQAIPTNVSQLNNDAGYITMEQMPAGMTGTQTGDIMYWDAATSTWIMMPAGSAGQVLTVENGVPVWASLPDYVTMNLPPTVTTNVPMEVTQSSVLCGGVVTSDGSVQLTACGVCWSTHHFPTISDAHTDNGMDVGAFTAHVEGLAHNTTYYVRAYATNNMGTTYGAEMTFTTADIPSDSLLMPDPCSSTDTNAVEQPLLGPNYLMCAGSDSVELTLNNYQYGAIQWQYSTDTVSWFDIPGAIDEQLTYKPEQTQFVRAAVSYANCATEYSEVKLLQKTPSAYAGISRTVNYGDTLRLQANTEADAAGNWQILQGANGFLTAPSNAASKFFGTDSLYRLRWTLTNSCGTSSDDISVRYVQPRVNSNVVVVDTTDIIFSDSAQLSHGYYVISFSDSNIVIGDSTILVSIVNGGFLRKVDSWEMRDDTTYAMYTSQASLSDFLESGVINFGGISNGGNETEINEDENVVENASVSNSPMQNALSAQGVEFLDHIPTREELREHPEMNGKLYVTRMEFVREDGSIVDLMPRGVPQGGPRNNAPITYNEKEHCWEYSNGSYLTLNSIDGIRFGETTLKLDCPKMEYCNVQSYNGLQRYLKLGFDNANCEWEGKCEITPSANNDQISNAGVTLGTLVVTQDKFIEGIPINCTLNIRLDFTVNGSLNISTNQTNEFKVSTKFTHHIEYDENNGYTEQKNLSYFTDNSPANNILPINGESINLDLSLKAKHDVIFYGDQHLSSSTVVLKDKMYGVQNQQGNQQGWKGKMTSDMSVNLSVKYAKAIDQIPSYSKDYTIYSGGRVYPDKVELNDGNKQTINASGFPLSPISVKVTGNDDKPVRNVPVYFLPQDGGSVSNNMVTTDMDGIAQTTWTPGTFNGQAHHLNAYVYDDQGNTIMGAPLDFTAFEPGQNNNCSTIQLLVSLVSPVSENINNMLELKVQNGTSPFTYFMDGDEIRFSAGVNLGDDNSKIIDMPAAGTHEFMVTDANSCDARKSYNVESTISLACFSLKLNVTTTSGRIEAEGEDGTSPYLYSLDGNNYSTNNVFTSLSAGTYTIHVMDFNGCHKSEEVEVVVDNSVTVPNLPCAGAETVTDFDGNVYNTVQIGQQCWMKENMRTTHYADGSFISIGYGRFYPNDDPGNVAKFGCLYNWYVATREVSSSANPSGVQGICPYGWHVPSDAEWTQLTNYVSAQPQWRCEGDGIAKGLASPYGWDTSTGSCTPGNGNYMNNVTGFSAPPAGRWYNVYSDFGTGAYFWSTTLNWSHPWNRVLEYNNTEVMRNYKDKNIAYSVRCLRN